MSADLGGKTILVVGGSSGIGRSISRSAADRGARVAVVGRRVSETTVAASDASGTAIIADLRRPSDCERIVTEAVAALGKIDVIIFTAAVAPLALLRETDADLWRTVFETNVIGPMLVAGASVDHLAPNGIMAFVSTESVGAPYHGTVAYTASKAALEDAVRGLRVEHPEFRVMCIPVGATIGTDITRGADPDLITRLYPQWIQSGRLMAASMQPEHVADAIVNTISGHLANPGVSVENLTIRPALGSSPTDVEVVLAQVETQAEGAS